MARSNRAAVALIACAWVPLGAHDVISTKITWTQEISRIFYARCSNCHREGGTAPMALTSYQQVRPWAKAIKEEVHERRMPPWGAVKGFGEFDHDPSLTAEEIHLIADWVEGGAPEGDPQYLPALPRAAAAPTPRPGSRALRNGERLAAPLRLNSIAAPAAGLEKGASLQAVAVAPGGEVIPLLWLHGFQPRFARGYAYRVPPRLPAGSVIRITGPAASVRVAAIMER